MSNFRKYLIMQLLTNVLPTHQQQPVQLDKELC